MTAYNLLSELRQAGVVVKASGTDRLVVDAPKGALTPDLRTALAAHKKELLAILTVTEKPAPEVGLVHEPSASETRSVAPYEVATPAPIPVQSPIQSIAPNPVQSPTESIEEKIRGLEQEAARLRAEQEARRAEVEGRQRVADEIKRLDEEAARLPFEEESRRAEREAMRLADEERWQAAAAARKKAAEEADLHRAEEERRVAQLEARRHAEEEIARRRSEEEIRKVEEQLSSLRAQEVSRRAEVTARWQAEDERWRAEMENQRLADEHAKQQLAEAERQRLEVESRIKAEDEASRNRTQARIMTIREKIARLRAEQESYGSAEARRREEAAASRRAAADEARQRAEEQARLKAEEDAQRAEHEARLRALEEERRHLEEQARQQAEASVRRDGPEWFQVDLNEHDDARLEASSATPLTLPDIPGMESESEGTFIEYKEFEPKGLQLHSSALVEDEKGDFHFFGEDVASSVDQAMSAIPAMPNTTLERLGSENVSERCAAVAELPRLGGEDAFTHISTAFDDPAEEVRSAAARALFSFQADRAAAFTRALREAPAERRRRIGSAIASSGLASEAISHLTGESREKTYDAFSLLFLMSKAGEVQPLLRAIEEHSNIEVRLAVVKLLALSGQHEILPAFRRLAVRGSLPPEVRSSVMEAIYQISSQGTGSGPVPVKR
ncbi:MAG TPA: hypothetical protein VGJ55_09090 [Pyrinomonadaceae bacterium]